MNTDNIVLLVIDVQEGILDKGVHQKEEMLRNIVRLMDYFHTMDKPVVLIRHTNSSKFIQDSNEWQISSILPITEKDQIFNKNVSSVFKDEKFGIYLHEQGLQHFVIIGLVTDGCIKNACEDGVQKGFDIILIKDAHSTIHEEAELVIADWNRKLEEEGINVIPTEEFLRNFPPLS